MSRTVAAITRVVDGNLRPLGYFQNTDQNPAVSLATIAGGTIPVGADQVLIQAEAADIRWRDDGTSPTASVGMLIAAGNDFWYTGDLSTLEIFEVSASSIVNVSFYEAT